MSHRVLVFCLIVLTGCSSGTIIADPPPPPTVILLPDDTHPATTGIFIAALNGSATNRGNTWVAVAEVIVLDNLDEPVPRVVVSGGWSEGDRWTATCTTDDNGTCELESDSIRKRVPSAVLEIASLEHVSLPYRPQLAAEFDPEAEPRTVTVPKP